MSRHKRHSKEYLKHWYDSKPKFYHSRNRKMYYAKLRARGKCKDCPAKSERFVRCMKCRLKQNKYRHKKVA